VFLRALLNQSLLSILYFGSKITDWVPKRVADDRSDSAIRVSQIFQLNQNLVLFVGLKFIELETGRSKLRSCPVAAQPPRTKHQHAVTDNAFAAYCP
jgi:hypothetical protein